MMASSQVKQQQTSSVRQSGRVGTMPLIPELDGVRGIAVLLVMLCHNNLIQPIPATGSICGIALPGALDLGWSGVDLFFVLSGFLITGILLDTKASNNYLSSFYARRVLRILPLYLLYVFAYFHIVLPLAHHLGQWKSLSNSLEPWFWFHLSNWKIAFGAPANWLAHFWSLSVEEQFYLFWPVVVFFAGRRWLPCVCLALIGVSFSLRYIFANHNYSVMFLYELTPFRVEPLAFGSLGALLVRQRRMVLVLNRRCLFGMGICGVLLLSVALWSGRSTSVGKAPMATYGYTAFALMYVSLVLYAYLYSGSPTRIAALLRRPVLRSFGKYSYAIYVFHYPLFIIYGLVLPRASVLVPPQARLLFWLVALLVGIASSYAVALTSWHLLEKHFWGLKRCFSVKY
jgi:peptidoglycan/LPS O-acetylase OafA/YrhL